MTTILGERLEPRYLLAVSWSQDSTNVYVNNGIISATILKSDSSVKDMRLLSKPAQNLMDPTRGLYWSLNVTVTGQSTVWSWLNAGQLPAVSVSATSSMVDVKFVNNKMNYDATTLPNGSFSAELHIVLLEGEAGLYTYHVLRHGAGQPEVALDLDMHQMRVNSIFTSSTTNNAWSFTPNERIGKSMGATPTPYTDLLPEVQEFPATSYFTQPTGAIDSEGFPIYTENVGQSDQGLPTWSKYDWHSYMGNSTRSRTAFGDATDQLGMWFIQGSQEFYNGGPTKGKATVSGNLLYADFTNDHGLGGGGNKLIAADEVYEKFVGPVFIYANAGTNHTALWADAQARGAAEVNRFPNYAWLNVSESLFPKKRGRVTGKLNLPGGPASNAQMILGDGSGLDWQLQGYRNFLFWSKADANGNFSIDEVRPGNYMLYAYVPGTFGEFQQANITVTANTTTDLGTITWTPANRQKVLWQIGTPDRSTEEYKFGDRLRQYGLWNHYLAAEPAIDMDYIIGTSTPSQDWYYAQMIIPTGARTDTAGVYRGAKWNVKFNLSASELSSLSSTLTLTTALAGSQGTAFYVDVNGTNAVGGTTGQYTHSDPAIYRNAVKRGYAQTFSYSINKSLLVAGQNTFTFRLRAPGGAANDGMAWTGTKPVIPSGGIMWDSIKLESGGLQVGSPVMYYNDIGTTGIAGATTYSGGVFTVSGAGAGIAGTADAFQFVSNTLTADGAITARLDSQVGGGSAAKSGLMLRDNPSSNSPFFGVFYVPGTGVQIQYRDSSGASAVSGSSVSFSGSPWLKLIRVGSTVYAYYSSDGVSWSTAGSRVMSNIGAAAMAGLAVTGGSTTAARVSTFSNLSMTQSANPTAVQSLGYQVDATPHQIEITLSEDVSPSLSLADFAITRSDGATMVPDSFTYIAATNTARVILSPTAADGNYTLTLRRSQITDPAGGTFASDVTLPFYILAGDVNRDRIVDTLDFNVLAGNFGSVGKVFSQGNVNYDAAGEVSSLDFNVLAAHYGVRVGAVQAALAMTGSVLFRNDGSLSDRSDIGELI